MAHASSFASGNPAASNKGYKRQYRTATESGPPLRHPAPIIWATVLNARKRIATSDTTNTLRRWVLAEN